MEGVPTRTRPVHRSSTPLEVTVVNQNHVREGGATATVAPPDPDVQPNPVDPDPPAPLPDPEGPIDPNDPAGPVNG